MSRLAKLASICSGEPVRGRLYLIVAASLTVVAADLPQARAATADIGLLLAGP